MDIYLSTSKARRFHVDIYPALVRWIFTSIRCRFYVEKYLCGYGIFFNVEWTSILRRQVFVQTWYIFQRRFNVEIFFHEECRFINVEYKSIPRRCFPHGIRQFFDVECVGDVEVPDDVPLAFLCTLHQRCILKNKGKWIYQVNYIQELISERKFTSNHPIVRRDLVRRRRPGARWA